MSDSTIDAMKAKIAEKHGDDEKQLEFVLSSSKRLLVEAPAGYGKTSAMVSKIAYMFVTQQIPNPKRLLALTFSVNAAYKIKKDVSQKIPDLLAAAGARVTDSDRIFVSNYHGFCRNVLKKYGHKLHLMLPDIDKLQSVDDGDIKGLMKSAKGLAYTAAAFMSDYNGAVKNNNFKYIIAHFKQYNNMVVKELLPISVIPYNAILTLTMMLFKEFPEILEFYQKYFTAILVDEYQDTNYLSYMLIANLITDETRVILLGDSLQRIYGFIGAVPNLLSISEKKFGLLKIQLSKNHRFASNVEMLQLDSNIRRNAENPYFPIIDRDALIHLAVAQDQEQESVMVVDTAVSLLEQSPDSKVAILVKQRGPNVNKIIELFGEFHIPYFFGLFTDEDPAYIKFHRKCLFEFIELIKAKGRITKKVSATHIDNIKALFKEPDSLISALIDLLDIFWSRLFSEYAFLSDEDKILLIRDTFEHNSLKQYIEFAQADIVVSTVHAAKGLEWDFVILPDMEEDLFPNWFGLCSHCGCKSNCQLVITEHIEKKFLEELSVFYVAVTRAKKQVYFTASKTQIDSSGNQRVKRLSCFLNLPGIKHSEVGKS